ncbi:serine-threonine rich protein [Aspergillus ellipticus CBS 707.79]|uniref:Serine-threonine rich protein n=1 Tax=Aspergillus ellipticus CBS 707.79 TaxID=1448320 RepID=A0A319DIT2_9EURO|nr:serine-threonine rich protein [Aspergillus ellipticus CBS 707.79]
MVYPVAVSHIRAVRWSTTLTGDRPQAILFSSSRLLKPSSQCRLLWKYSRGRHNYDDLLNRIDNHNRVFVSKPHDRPSRPPRKAHTAYESRNPWENKGYGINNHKSKRCGPQSEKFHGKNFWGARTRAQQRVEQLKKEIEKDPYAAVFGRRLDPFGSITKFDNTFTSLCRSFMGLDKSANATDTTARTKTAPAASSFSTPVNKADSDVVSDKTLFTGASPDPSRKGYKFDPISGRMIPKDSGQSNVTRSSTNKTSPTTPVKAQKPQPENAGYMSPIDRPVKSGLGAVTANHRTENSTKSGTAAKTVADEDIQTQEKQQFESAVPIQDETLIQSTTSQKGSKEVFEEADGPSEAIIVGSFRVQDGARPEDTPNNGMNAIHKKFDLPEEIRTSGPHSNLTMMSEHRDQGDAGRPTPRPYFDSAQQPAMERMEKEEDLDLLRASDIRNPYHLKSSKRGSEMTKQTRQDLDATFDSYVDPVGNIDAKSVRGRFQRHEVAETSDEPTRPVIPDVQAQPDPHGLKSTESPKIQDQNENQGATQSFGHAAETEQPLASKSSTGIYRVLAYDPTTLQISEAETSTSFHASNESCDPTEVLSRLNTPAKFLPHFAKMRTDGYEIVSGGGDILVFRKSHVSLEDDVGLSSHAVKGILGDQTEAERETSSPSKLPQVQGRVNAEDFPHPPPNHEAILTDADASTTKRSSKRRSRIGNTLRKMLFGGAVTAGTCYAIGVVTEYFRTGGQDGRGIDGFTEFESDRRHRD